MIKMKFLYAKTLPVKKCIGKDKQPIPGKCAWVVAYGDDYNDCFNRAKSECNIKSESQVISAVRLH
jgi:hypothetical protein